MSSHLTTVKTHPYFCKLNCILSSVGIHAGSFIFLFDMGSVASVTHTQILIITVELQQDFSLLELLSLLAPELSDVSVIVTLGNISRDKSITITSNLFIIPKCFHRLNAIRIHFSRRHNSAAAWYT
jgi:hypothetical protein